MSCVSNISLGNLYGLACKTDGTVRGWGFNTYNQASGGNNLTNIRKVDAGMFFSVGLRNNGTVTGWGCGTDCGINLTGLNPLTNIVDISAHNNYTLTLRSDGLVRSIFDSNFTPESFETGPDNQTNVTGICAGWSHSYLVYNNGNMVGFGGVVNGQSPISLSNVKSVKCGGLYTFAALLNNGRITGWNGAGTSNRFISDPGITYIDFAPNDRGVLGLKSDGTLTYWGDTPNTFITLLTYNNVTHVAGPHGGNGFVIGRSDGLVTGFGEVATFPTNGAYTSIPNICGTVISSSSSSSNSSSSSSSSSSNPSISSSSSSRSSSSSFLNAANIRATGWGRLEGPVYNPAANYITEPFMTAAGRLGSITGIKKVVAGLYFHYIIFNNGKISGWADISQTGKCFAGGPCSNRWNLPELISNLDRFSNVDDAYIGMYRSVIKFNNGRISGWDGGEEITDTFFYDAPGYWSDGYPSLNKWNACRTITGVKQVAVGKGVLTTFGLALLENGRITGWGFLPNNGGHLISGGINLTGVVKIDCGQNYAFALLNNGVLTGWGHPTTAGCTSLGGPGCYDGFADRCGFGAINLRSAVGLTGVKDFSCGPYWALGVILNNNRVTGFGNNRIECNYSYINDAGQSLTCSDCRDPSRSLMAGGLAAVNNINKIPESIHMGSYNHIVKFTDGTIYGWGIDSNFNELPYEAFRLPQLANINNNTLFNIKDVSVNYENILVLYDPTSSSSSSSSNSAFSSSSSSLSSSSSSLEPRYGVYLNFPV